jgi:ribose transport system permease protein
MSNIEDAISRQETTLVTRLLTSQAFLVLLAVLVASVALHFATNGVFSSDRNLFNITRNATFVGLIALGMTFVIITGGIDLSVGSVLMLSSMVCAKVMNAGYGIEYGIATALSAALLVGFVNGVMIADLRFPPFVVTLAMMSIARSLGMVTSQNTTISKFGPDHDSLLWIGGGSLIQGVPNPVLIALTLCAICAFVLSLTRFGRYVMAIGGSERAAEAIGVPVRQIKVGVYMISSLSAGICGVVEVAWLGAVTTNLGAGMELQVIAAAVIGGANLAGGSGTAIGAIIGAMLIEIIRNSLGLLGINAYWQGTFIGSAILFAVHFDRIANLRRDG